MKYLLVLFAVSSMLVSCLHFVPARSTNPDNYLRLGDIGEVTDVDWSSDSTHILIGGNQLYIYEIDTNNLTQLNWRGGGPVTDVAWQPMSQMIVATNSPDVDIWDSETRTVQIGLENHIQYRIFNSASWSPSGDMLAVTSQGGAPRGIVRVWDTSDFEVIHTITLDSFQAEDVGYSAVVFSPNGNSLAFVNIGNNTIEVWSTIDWELMLELEGHEATITDLAWHDQNSWLASSDSNGSVMIWDLSSGQEFDNYSVSNALTAIDWASSGDTLALASSSGVLTWNLRDNTIVDMLSESANDISWSPDGSKLAVATLDGLIVFEMTKGER